jgi:hypothetical protein
MKMIEVGDVREFMEKRAFDYIPLATGGLGALIGGRALVGATPFALRNKNPLYSVLPAILGAGIGGTAGIIGGNMASSALNKIDMSKVGDKFNQEMNDIRINTAPRGIYANDNGIVIRP